MTSDDCGGLRWCREQQRECKEYLDGPGPDKDGAWRGLCDVLMEECLILIEERDE